MRWVKVALIGVCLGTLSVLACIAALDSRPHTSRPATVSPHYPPFDPPDFPRPSVRAEIDWQPAPEFQAWLAARPLEPDPPHMWLATITGATKAGNTMIVSTSLPSDSTAAEPAKKICSVAIEFMTANPDRRLRNVGVTGAEQGELVRGGLDHPCKIGPYLLSRL